MRDYFQNLLSFFREKVKSFLGCLPALSDVICHVFTWRWWQTGLNGVGLGRHVCVRATGDPDRCRHLWLEVEGRGWNHPGAIVLTTTAPSSATHESSHQTWKKGFENIQKRIVIKSNILSHLYTWYCFLRFDHWQLLHQGYDTLFHWNQFHCSLIPLNWVDSTNDG